MTLYEAAIILGISKNSTTQDLRKSWRKQAMQYHPDRNPDPGASEHFVRVQNAFEVLANGGLEYIQLNGLPRGMNRRPVRNKSRMIGGPSVQPTMKRLTYVNPMYWEEQAWLESQFGHLGSFGRRGTRRR